MVKLLLSLAVTIHPQARFPRDSVVFYFCVLFPLLPRSVWFPGQKDLAHPLAMVG